MKRLNSKRESTQRISTFVLLVVLVIFCASCGNLGGVPSGNPNGVFDDGKNKSIVGKDHSVCPLEMFPLSLPVDNQKLITMSDPVRNGTFTFSFEVTSVSELTHGADVLQAQGLVGERFKAEMFVNISYAFKPDSVDLELKSFEPTVWVLKGNTTAVRKILITGEYCSTVISAGIGNFVAPAQITIDTQQFKFNPGINTDLFPRVIKENIFEGSLIGRVFLVR